MESRYKDFKIPRKDKLDPITEEEGKFIYDFLKERGITKTLEIGFGCGCSAAYIMAATQHKHYAIDPFLKSCGNRGLKNIQKTGLGKHLTFENDFSHNVLPRLLREGLKVDFAFIDGGHTFDTTFVEFYYIDMMLNQNGYVLFHDPWLESIQRVISWIEHNKKNYVKTETPFNILIVQKTREDKRDWRHFESF